MDRNEEFRKRLDKRLNKGGLVNKRGFDPTPYVDILMEKIDYEDYEDGEDLQEFMDEVLQDPSYDFIFGSTSLLSTEQKTKTAMMLLKRIRAYHDFDPEPHAQYLIDVYGTPSFERYISWDENGDQEYDFDPYFADYNFTQEQKGLIEGDFYSRQSENSEPEDREQARNVKMLTPRYAFRALLALLIGVIIPSFFIPNLLQRFGWLPSDAGWLLKIGVGIVSFIVLFFIFKYVMKIILNRTLDNIERKSGKY